MFFSPHTLLDLLFPPTCIRCQREGTWLCSLCQNSVPKQLVSWCPTCCSAVREQSHAHVAALGFERILSWLPYHVPWVERAVQDIKFGGMSSYARVLGAELAERFRLFSSQRARLAAGSQPQRVAAGSLTRSVREHDSYILMPIPLSKKRERERGFNQADVLARALGTSLRIPVERCLQRNKTTKAQAKLSAEERFANVADAFHLTTARGRGISFPRRQGTVHTNLELSGKTCILLDDVVTTGATLSAAASVLRTAGAESIIALTVAYSDIRKELWRGGRVAEGSGLLNR